MARDSRTVHASRCGWQNGKPIICAARVPAFSLRLPHDLERRLGEEALHCGLPRSELIREDLEDRPCTRALLGALGIRFA
jgi:hypothetical protein